jgi:deoxycytidylate deaminase
MRPQREPKGSVPPDSLLETAAPLEMWRRATKQAQRSVFRRHRVGAVLFRGNTILSNGCSHDSDLAGELRSVHAERHALQGLWNIWRGTRDIDCLVVTLTRSDNFAQVSKPCASCAQLLLASDIRNVIYAERTNDGSWTVRNLPVEFLNNCKSPRLSS